MPKQNHAFTHSVFIGPLRHRIESVPSFGKMEQALKTLKDQNKLHI